MSRKRVHFDITKLRKKGEHGLAECKQKLNGKFIHRNYIKSKDGKERVLLLQDFPRELIVPKTEFSDSALIVSKSTYDKFKYTPQAELQAKDEEQERQLVLAQIECDKRKAAMKKTHVVVDLPTHGQVMQNDADEKNRYVLERAKTLMAENNEEVKFMNSIILATKVRVTREAQRLEKELIKREQEEENRRLDLIMEEKQNNELRKEMKQREEMAEKTRKLVASQMQQIYDSQFLKTKALQLKEEESRTINKALIALQHEEIEKEKQRHARKFIVQAELKKAKEERELFLRKRKEEEILADKARAEFLKMKQKRMDDLEKERAAIKMAKEMEIARMGASQKREQDLQAIKLEQNAIVVIEEREREYRRNIKEAALKRREDNVKIMQEREKQIEDVRKSQAIQLKRREEEFRKIAEDQRIMIAKSREQQRLLKETQAQNRKFILKQVEEKEIERNNMRKKITESGNAYRIEMELRDLEINETLARKLEVLKASNFPEHCIKDIQREFNVQYRSRHIL